MKLPFELAPGIVGDDTDYSTPGWRDARNVRFWRGKPETIGGWERLSLTNLSGVCRTVMGWSDENNLLCFAFGRHNGLSVWQNGDLADITPTAFVSGEIDGTGSVGYGTGAYGVGGYGEPSATDYFPLTWSFGTRYGRLYANPRNQTIFRWDNDTGDEAEPLTGAPAQVISILTTFTSQVMALGCTDTGSQFNPSCVRISDVLDDEEWAVSTTTTAQQYYLEGNGRIVGGRQVGRYVFVWTDAELHFGSYTDSWNFERVGAGCGLAGPNAAVVIGQTAYWVSTDLQFYACSPGEAPRLLVCPIREDFKENAASGQNDKIVAASISERAEVVWHYADQRDGYEVSRTIRLSTIDGAWSRGDVARTAFVDSNPAPSPVGVTFGGAIYWHERGSSADGAPLSAMIRTGGQYLDQVMMLRGLWPDFHGENGQKGPVYLTIRARLYPQGPETVHGPFALPANASKADFLVTGRVFDFEFTSDSSPSSWRMGKLTFDVEPAGDR